MTNRSAAARKRHPRRHIRYYSPRVDTHPSTELLLEIGTRLKDPAPNAISYGTALDGFYTQPGVV